MRFPTSSLCDGGVGGGLHRHGRGRAFADGGGRKVSETRLSSDGLGSGTAAVAEGILDNSLEERADVRRPSCSLVSGIQPLFQKCLFHAFPAFTTQTCLAS